MRFSVLVVTVVLCTTGTSALASSGQHRFFLAPEHGISCELASSYPRLGTFAYCQTIAPHEMSVMMKATGTLKVCHGIGCIGNPPLNDPTLRYGLTVNVGPFRCTSLQGGVRCVVQSGHGFMITANGVTRI